MGEKDLPGNVPRSHHASFESPLIVGVLTALAAAVALFIPAIGGGRYEHGRTGSAERDGKHLLPVAEGAEIEREPEPDRPDLAFEWRRLSLLDENGRIEPGALVKAIRQREKNAALTGLRIQSAPTPIAGIDPDGWTSRGPQNVGARTRALVIDPTDSSILWAGCVSGGVWKSTNSGTTWAPTDDFMLNLAANCLTMDPSNSDVLYCGTGEGYFNSDAVQGDGIFKTTDGGNTWNQLASTAGWLSDGSGRNNVNRIAIARTNSNLILAGTTYGGIQRSTDGGDSWSTVYGAQGSYDIAFDPYDDTKLIAHIINYDTDWYHLAVFSTDGGATWQNSNLSHVEGFNSRIELRYAPSSPSTVYASLNTNMGLTCSSPPCASTGGLWKSTDGGQTYTRMSSTTDTGVSWYDDALWVSPTNPNLVVTGGADLYRTTDGGNTFTEIAAGYLLTQDPHPDEHLVLSDPGFDGVTNKKVYVCTDGGVFVTNDITTASDCETCGWSGLYNTYQTVQYYGAAGNGTTGLIVGGSQDNGTLTSPTGSQTANLLFGGDGGFSAVDPTDDTYCYGEYINLQIVRSQDHGQTASYIYSGITDAGSGASNFVSPFILDPNNPDVMLAGGTSLWRSTDVKTGNPPAWTAIRGPGTAPISAIAVAPGNSNIIWIALNDGTVFRTANGTAASPTWITVEDNVSIDLLPNRYPNRILIDAANSSLVYIAFGGYSSGNFLRTTNNGTSWTALTGSGSNALPDAPVRGIARHPNNANWLYVGTEVGLFASTDGGATWSTSNQGPANVSVDELTFMSNSTVLLAATHGRGIWTATATAPPNYIGFVDSGTCTTISGWAADRNRPNTPINVEVYDGGTLLTSVSANISRPDVAAYLGDNGIHGFSIPTPSALLNGAAHSVHVKFETSTTDLSGSPFSLTCGASLPPSYIGYVDGATCTFISGWAADKNHLNTSINVELYDGTKLIAIVPAVNSRPDVAAYLGDNGLHGYSIPTPDSLKTGAAHSLHVRFAATATDLSGSPASIDCASATPNYVGYVDVANCSQIAGWAADRNRLNLAITVEVYDGSTLILTVDANLSRPDVGAYLGDNGEHGFSIPVPAALQTSSAHSVHVKFETSATDLSGSPASLTCAPAASTPDQPDAIVPGASSGKTRAKPKAKRS